MTNRARARRGVAAPRRDEFAFASISHPNLSIVVPGECYHVDAAGFVFQAHIEKGNAQFLAPTVVLVDDWDQVFLPRLEAVREAVGALFPKSTVALEYERAGGAPWVVRINYGLTEAELDDAADSHREVLGIFSDAVSGDESHLVSLQREFLAPR